jgi:hypothetical protein
MTDLHLNVFYVYMLSYNAQVLIAKSDSLYAVAMLEAGELAVIPIADYNLPLRTVADAIGAGADLEVYTHTIYIATDMM